MDITACSSLLMGVSRLMADGEAVIDQLKKQIKVNDFLEKGAVLEIANIIHAICDLRYRDDILMEEIVEELIDRVDKIELIPLISVFHSLSWTYSDNENFVLDLGPELHKKLVALKIKQEQADVNPYELSK